MREYCTLTNKKSFRVSASSWEDRLPHWMVANTKVRRCLHTVLVTIGEMRGEKAAVFIKTLIFYVYLLGMSFSIIFVRFKNSDFVRLCC